MKTYKDTATGKVWQFDDKLTLKQILALPNTPKTIEPYTIPEPTQEELLTNAKDAKKTEMVKAYTTANEQLIDYMNTTFQADKDSQALIIAVLSAGTVPDGFYWLDISNKRIPMTYLELQNMSAALVIRGQINFTKLQDLKVLIDSKLKVSTVEAVSW